MMASTGAALKVCVDNDSFPLLLPYTFPVACANRMLRANIDRLHLHNVKWGRECGVCDKKLGNTFVLVIDNEQESPIIYACVLCAKGFWPTEEHP